MPRTELGLLPIYRAQQRISPFIRRTPMVRSSHLSALTGGDIWLKLECHQITGSFKARGALNKVGLLTSEQRARGIVTGSAGNHGLGVALAARAWGDVRADIFVPTNAPQTKVDKLRHMGVSLHQVGTTYEDAHQAAEAFARETGATYIQAYDDVDVIAGQGTLGLEVLTDLPHADLVLVPIGGGGMVAGVATVVKGIHPGCRVVGVQPEASPAALLSLRDGVPYDPYDHQPTIADGLAGGFGAVPFLLARTLIDDVLLVSETAMRRAIFTLLDREQLVVEPSGAISIAPLLTGDLEVVGQSVVCILSGGNIATPLLRDILSEFVCNPHAVQGQ
jgi:threonine dehydratase